MKDVHVHFLHGAKSGYNKEFLASYVETAVQNQLTELYLLEHTDQFYEFTEVYEPIRNYNEYQKNWIEKRMANSIEPYIEFINLAKTMSFPIKVKFGLEVCYIPEKSAELRKVLNNCEFDFLTGSVHWIDGWGFDHPKQKDTWDMVNVNSTYARYYEIMIELCKSGLFTGVAHPDSIKCFGHYPSTDLQLYYDELSKQLNAQQMYAENSGGLKLNYCSKLELGLNKELLLNFKKNKVTVCTASDAHKKSDIGANIYKLEEMLKDF